MIDYEKTFSDFKVVETRLPTGPYDVYYEFKDPETSNGAMGITFIQGYLHIQGDYGSSQYTWHNNKLTIHDFARFAKSEEYFFSKCELSKYQMTKWSSDIVIDMINNNGAEDFEGLDIIEVLQHNENDYDWATFCYDNNLEDYVDIGLVYKDMYYLHANALIQISKKIIDDNT